MHMNLMNDAFNLRITTLYTLGYKKKVQFREDSRLKISIFWELFLIGVASKEAAERRKNFQKR